LNPEKKCMLSRYHKAGQKHSIKIPNRSSEDVAKFKHLGTTPTDQNCMQEEIKSRLHSEVLATTGFRVFCPPDGYLGT
jgi:hypothetical protein